jgi:hypothetical protein
METISMAIVTLATQAGPGGEIDYALKELEL